MIIDSNRFNSLSQNDKNLLTSLWMCPYDASILDKRSGQRAGKLEIRRGKDSIAIQNAVNMRKISEKEDNHAKAVTILTFQLFENELDKEDDIITYQFVECTQCKYNGIAPFLPVELDKSNQKKEIIIQELLEASQKMGSGKRSGSGMGGRRFPFFGIFILIWLLPLIAMGSFLGWLAIFILFTLI